MKRGAVAAYAFDYKDLGRQAGYMARRDPRRQGRSRTSPCSTRENLVLSINAAAAEAMGVTIPEDVTAEAAETF